MNQLPSISILYRKGQSFQRVLLGEIEVAEMGLSLPRSISNADGVVSQQLVNSVAVN